MTIMLVHYNMQNMSNMHNTDSTAPSAHSLCTRWLYFRLKYKVVVFPPDRCIKEEKMNGLEAGGCCDMGGPICGCMSSRALPLSPESSGCNGGSSSMTPHRLKVRILITETE